MMHEYRQSLMKHRIVLIILNKTITWNFINTWAFVFLYLSAICFTIGSSKIASSSGPAHDLLGDPNGPKPVRNIPLRWQNSLSLICGK